jgi:hypothetical protein
MKRSLVVAVVLLMAWTSLSACYLGPDPVQYAALAVVDGRPTAVVAVCGRSTVGVVVYRNDDTMDDGLHEWSVTVTPPDPVQDVDVELFGAARPGWEITSDEERTIQGATGGVRIVPLTSIEPGHRYTLDSSESGPEGASAPAVTFTTADLAKIGAGQVLAPVDHKSSEVMSRDDFISERCD